MRVSLDFLRQKYKSFPGFDCNVVRNEWECLKQPLHDFLDNVSINQFKNTFWKDFILLKTTTNSHFISQYKNILFLLNIYLISPTNNAECELLTIFYDIAFSIFSSRLLIVFKQQEDHV